MATGYMKKICPESLVIREMEIRTTLRFYLSHIIKSVTKESRSNTLARLWKKKTSVHCWWKCKLLYPLWKVRMKIPQKPKHRNSIGPVITPGYLHRKVKTYTLQRYIHIHFYSSIFIIAKFWKWPICLPTDG